MSCLGRDRGQGADEVVLTWIPKGAAEGVVQEMQIIDQQRVVLFESLEQHACVGLFERKGVPILHHGEEVDRRKHRRVGKSGFAQPV